MKKIISILGFAKKANKIVSGQTSLKRYKGKLSLIMVCNSATENLKNLAKNLSVKHDCPVIETKIALETLLNMEGIKIIGITDENFAGGILLNKESISIG